MLLRKKSVVLLIAGCIASPVFGQAPCSEYITKATATIVQAAQTSNPNDLAAGFYHACGMTYQQYAQAYGASAKVAFLRFGGKGEFTERSFEEFQKNRCKQVTRDDARSAARYYFQQGSDKAAIEQWKKCMQDQDGLACWVEPGREGSDVVANINWKSSSEKPAKIRDSRLSDGNTAKGAPAGNLLPKGETLSRGLKTIPIERKPGSELVSSVSIEADGAANTCSLYVPSRLPQIPFDVAAAGQ